MKLRAGAPLVEDIDWGRLQYIEPPTRNIRLVEKRPDGYLECPDCGGEGCDWCLEWKNRDRQDSAS